MALNVVALRRSGVNVIKLFPSSLTVDQNKLERFFCKVFYMPFASLKFPNMAAQPSHTMPPVNTRK